jgi:hypothetical protein
MSRQPPHHLAIRLQLFGVPDSACRKTNAICSSENRFFGIGVLLSFQKKYPKIRASSGAIYGGKTLGPSRAGGGERTPGTGARRQSPQGLMGWHCLSAQKVVIASQPKGLDAAEACTLTQK